MLTTLRRHLLTRPILKRMRKALPGISETEREALEAGDVWWDAELFTGNPDWSKLLNTPPAQLSQEEQAFLNGPVEELCHMLNDWEINWERRFFRSVLYELRKPESASAVPNLAISEG